MSEPTPHPSDHEVPTRKVLTTGFFLIAVFLPLGLTLEALHAMKFDVYLQSSMRREMWTLAHAHGGVLGILCLVFGAVGPRFLTGSGYGGTVQWLRAGAILMPVGFLLGGIGNHEGDPGLGILLVPIGGLLLLVALVRAGTRSRRVSA